MTEQRVQRRLAAILAADVAGYSRLMGIDEEGTLAALTSLRSELLEPSIAEYRGRLVKTTGDGLLAEFPSVVEAVRCAVAIQEGTAEQNAGTPAARRIVLRIGINLGDVIVQDDDLYGDGVNVAARLEQISEAGGICLSGDAYRQVRGKLDLNATDIGEQHLKNIDTPVRVYQASIAPQAGPAMSAGNAVRRRFVVKLGVGLVVAAGLLAIWALSAHFDVTDRGGAGVAHTDSSREPDLPIIAVLPFANQTGDTNQDYFADGVTEDVINALGRFNALRVISHNAVSSFKADPVMRDEIARSVSASYLVEGSVKHTGDRVRIAARLIDAESATVLWTDRYDGQYSEIFDFQDAIAREIAGKLAIKIVRIRGREALEQPRPDQDAYELVLKARAIGFKSGRSSNRRYRELVAKAIELDPEFAAAHALLAEASYVHAVLGWTGEPDRQLAEAEAHAREAIRLAPNEPEGHRALGRILVTRTEYDQARDELRRAIEINPSDAAALAVQGIVQAYEGDLDTSIGSLELALKLDPALDASDGFHLALAYYLDHRDADALRMIQRSISRFPDFSMFYVLGAVVATHLGHVEQAERFAEEAHGRLPFLDADMVGSRFKLRELQTYLREGLRLAGF